MNSIEDRPSFTDELTLRLSERIRTVQWLKGAKKFNPIDLQKLLEDHDIRDFLYSLSINVLDSTLWPRIADGRSFEEWESKWVWICPDHGKFHIYTFHKEEPRWKPMVSLVSRTSSFKMALPKKLTLGILSFMKDSRTHEDLSFVAGGYGALWYFLIQIINIHGGQSLTPC